MDSLAGLVFFLLIGKWYQNKTYQALSFERDYKSYFPVAVTVVKDGKEEGVPLEEIKKGDRIIIRNQELIPADGILISEQANINYSFVTGESKPVLKHQNDEVYAGGKQIGSTIEVEVTKEVMQSKLTQLWNQDLEKTESVKNLSTLIDKVSKNFTFVILTIAVITAIYWSVVDPTVVVFAFSSVLIVACPCALALAIPFTFGNTMRIFGRSKFYLKKAEVVESLTKVDTIVFDKTGTITYPDSYSVHYNGASLGADEQRLAKSLSRQSGHPLSIAVFDHLDVDYEREVDRFREIPSAGIVGFVDDKEVKMGSASFVNAPKSDTPLMQSVVYLAIDGVVKGHFCVDNHYREGLEEVIGQLQERYELHVISGDNEAERSRLKELLGDDKNLRFDQNPNDKLNYIKALQDQGKKVMMIGDGLNDAGALNQSNVGISIADDVFNFSPACDAILEGPKFYRLPMLLERTSSGMKIVYASFVISFLYNIVGLSFAVSGQLAPIIAAILMPVSSITVVAFVSIASRISMRKLNR
jgi:Cu+-exporting ATPase